MAKFEVVPLTKLKTRLPAKLQPLVEQFKEHLEKLRPDQGGRLVLEKGDDPKDIRRTLKAAAVSLNRRIRSGELLSGEGAGAEGKGPSRSDGSKEKRQAKDGDLSQRQETGKASGFGWPFCPTTPRRCSYVVRLTHVKPVEVLFIARLFTKFHAELVGLFRPFPYGLAD